MACWRMILVLAVASLPQIAGWHSGHVRAQLSSVSVHMLSTTDDLPAAQSGASPSVFAPAIILYTKHGCPLCEGLEANLQDVRQYVSFELSKRYIEDNAEWEEAYRYEVPVLVGATPSGGEMEIPRPSPRASGVFLLRWLRKHYFEQLSAAQSQ